MSLIAELKRRNVVRVGIAYAVAAWLLLQVTEVLNELLGLPPELVKIVVLVLAVGIIPALLLAWAFELTPEGIQKDTGSAAQPTSAPPTGRKLDRAIIALLAMVVVWFLVDEFYWERKDRPAQTPPLVQTDTGDESSLAGDEVVSIAVLPFANMSPDPDNEYFADGISEELLNLLVRIEALRVPSRTSSFAFKGQNRDIREIAGQLDVAHVLEGSVRKAGNQVRITAQLIDVQTDTHLWSETYDRDLEDIFAIQDEIAAHIVDALKIALSVDAQSPPTENLDAYTLYLQGRELFRRRGESLLEADRLLGEATQLDPDFADAWALQALVQATLPGYVKEDKEPYFQSALELAQKALELNPSQPDAQLAIGHIMALRGDVGQALDQFSQVLERQPSHSTARLWLGVGLLEAGYVKEALAELKIARSDDPANATVLDWYARASAAANRMAKEVIEPAQISLQLGRAQARVPLFYHFLNKQDLSGYEALLDDTDTSTPDWALMKRAFNIQKNPAEFDAAMALADEAEQAGAGYYTEYARFNFLLVSEDSERFFEQLELIERVDGTIATTLWLPSVQHHRQSQAMVQWARQRGMVDLWRERGWPDLCSPAGDDGLECE